MVKHFLLDNFDNYEKGKFVRDTNGELLGKGIFASDAKQWRVQRRAASHLFTNYRLRNQMTVSFCKYADRLIEKCEELRGEDKTVDMFDMFNRMTLDAFTKIAFGYDLGCIKKAPEVLPFMKAFNYVQEQMFRRGLTPI